MHTRRLGQSPTLRAFEGGTSSQPTDLRLELLNSPNYAADTSYAGSSTARGVIGARGATVRVTPCSSPAEPLRSQGDSRMKQCIALAACACLLATGCASTGKLGLGAGRQSTYSASARPTITRDYRKPGPDLGVQLASFNDRCDAGCGMGDECTCGCAVDGSGACGCGNGYGDGCGNGYGNGGYGACGGGGPCRHVIDGVASGFCGPKGPNGYGVCPHSHGYPEYPEFNQGPPVGQVAYPYYTVRGPRDFLRNNPPSIGPY
jgi:hypothetical protein